MQAADRGFAHVLTMSLPGAQALEERRAHVHQGFLELIGRAKDSGQLREGFTSRDLVLLLMASAGVLSATGDAAPDAWRRLVAWMIQPFRAPARGRPPDPPEDTALYEAMRRAGHGDIHGGAGRVLAMIGQGFLKQPVGRPADGR
ncbi:hypothetical protein ACWDE9_35745 [Streptomyces olivaceoviridis]